MLQNHVLFRDLHGYERVGGACYKVEVGDMIRFYRPFWFMNSLQFLIQYVKRDAAMGTNSTAANMVNRGEDSIVGKINLVLEIAVWHESAS